MLSLALAAALLLQAADTTGAVYDSPRTRALVERAVAASSSIPDELLDYRASVRSSLYLTLAPDSVAGGDLPASVDELVSEVRWARGGELQQTVQGHRTRVLIPLPYTLATILEQPWVIPHLYGSAIFTPFAGPQAVNPFGVRGPQFYRYTAEDPIRLRVQGELITLIPVRVRPRVVPEDERTVLVLGTFYLDADRAAVARARYGFAGGKSDLSRTLGRVETYMELENGLWEGRYWLPYRQRREILFTSRLLGGTVAARVINQFDDFDLNTGWRAEGPRVQLTWATHGPDRPFAGWEQAIGEEAGRYSTEDFSDLRLAVATESGGETGTQLQLHYERGNHLFRFNRVEGPYLGLGGRIVPPDPVHNRWEVYGTAGWAFAEGVPRGELSVRWGAAATRSSTALTDWGLELGAYRRLQDIQPFRPTYNWDWIYTLPALLWGSDTRDYYDAAGAELFGSARRGRWSARLGGRWERQDSVQVNTTRFLFGTSTEFDPLAGVEPGDHAALEASLAYSLGPGAFGVGNSALLRTEAEAGVGDFRFNRLTGLVSLRYNLGPLTLAARTDAGHAWGEVPPQRLFRFGSLEGLRGYEPNEFGGSSAVLARGRLLLGIPPRSTQPLARFGLFLIPPLRPAVVLVGESGWTRIDESLRDELLRLGARPTEGARSALGFGLSLFDDAFTIERLQPVGADADSRPIRWYIGLTYWY